ncbi:MAG: alpha-L-rhamnosidase C-terminal domain-containing protein [Pirellulales bacterium]
MIDRITWAKGIVPTPKGDIVSSWELESKQFTHHLTSPKGTIATIGLPISGLKDYQVSVNGKSTREPIKGIGKIESDGNYLYLRDLKAWYLHLPGKGSEGRLRY